MKLGGRRPDEVPRPLARAHARVRRGPARVGVGCERAPADRRLARNVSHLENTLANKPSVERIVLAVSGSPYLLSGALRVRRNVTLVAEISGQVLVEYQRLMGLDKDIHLTLDGVVLSDGDAPGNPCLLYTSPSPRDS